MLREKIRQEIIKTLDQIGVKTDSVDVEYPEAALGDYSTNAALVLAKQTKQAPEDLAKKISEKIDKDMFEKVEVAGPGFVNFRVKDEVLLSSPSSVRSFDRTSSPARLPDGQARGEDNQKILLEYFQPNIAKPLHVGHMRTAIIGDAIKRMLLYLGYKVESDTHMGDWGTQFGFLILGYKKYGGTQNFDRKDRYLEDPIAKLNELYIRVNQEAENNETIREAAKAEFVKLEKGDPENRRLWQQFVDWSMPEFLNFAKSFDLLPFDHRWPESFYEDKMPEVVNKLKELELLEESQGAQVVDLEDQGLGIAIIIKSDGGTTYLLRDLATFIFAKQQGFAKHLYVVDNRQALHYKQLFAILKLMGEMQNQEGLHIDYGFMSFKGEVLSTRKGNIVLAEDLVKQAQDKVSKIIQEKNPDLKNKKEVVKYVAIAALKFFDLSHNRHSDIEFDWDQVLDFEGKSGAYLQYTHARLASILRKVRKVREVREVTPTERRILFLLSIFDEKVADSLQDYLPNILADYLFELANMINRFYHESPVLAETDENVRNFRLNLVAKAKETLAKGSDLLGIKALDEM